MIKIILISSKNCTKRIEYKNEKLFSKINKIKDFRSEKQKIGNDKKLSDTRWNQSKNTKNDKIRTNKN